MTDSTHVVVGGGLAGLAAATYLARSGATVSLLEKASTIGGRAITDSHDGFAINRGVHALYTGGAASDVLRELGINYSSGSPGKILVRDARGFHAFPATATDLLRTTLLSGADKRELLKLLVRVSLIRPATLAYQTVEDWIAANANRARVQAVMRSLARVYLYCNALDIASAEVFISRLQQTLKHPIHYVDGGWGTLVADLRRAAISAGVNLITSACVQTVQVDSGLAAGVRLRDGSSIEAASVLLALPMAEAFDLLAEPRHIPATVPVYTACLDLALEELPRPDRAVAFDLEQPNFLTAQSEFARLAPAGGAVLHAFRQLKPGVAHDRVAERNALDEFVTAVQPDWQAHVVKRQFLPHMLASSSLPLASQGGFAGRPSHRGQDVANLYFAGDWVGPQGFLVDASLASARESARQMLLHGREPLAVAA